MSIPDVLGPDGLVAQRLENYEPRQQQLDMAQAVADAIDGKHHLMVEAGTGVGKSFAYLIPAILAARDSRPPQARRVSGERPPVVLSPTSRPAADGPPASIGHRACASAPPGRCVRRKASARRHESAAASGRHASGRWSFMNACPAPG